ncbi:MAG: YCF48-related protein [Saprospiraceae bacterium]
MKSLTPFFTTFSLCVFCMANAQAQWVSMPSNSTEHLRDLFFVSPDTGFVVGESNVLYKTTDGGDTWDDLHFNTLNSLGAIHFPSKNVGYLNGFKTLDLGNTWTPIIPASIHGINSLYFTNDSVGFCVTPGPLVGKTTDSGLSWEFENINVSAVHVEFEFTSDSIGYLVGWYPGSILKTTDQGATWDLLNNMQAISVNFPSKDTGYVVGWYGKIQKTTDAGSTWESQNSGLTQDRILFDVFCSDNNTCYAIGDSGVILKTTDGGQNWLPQHSGTMEELYSIFFTDENTGYVVGTNGTILKTNNGGALTGILPICNELPQVSVFPNPAFSILNIECPESKFPVLFKIFNAMGSELAAIPLFGVENILDLSNFTDGVYQYTLTSKYELIKFGRFVKQKHIR